MKHRGKKICPKDNPLIKELDKTRVALEVAYSNFENVIDPDLIDSCIFEVNAIQQKYRFLLREIKEQSLTANPIFSK